jgi:coenzyme F420-0:L-glutamate ligase/coenzyme F420-1:gamma-L-glutamate ligase
MPDPDPDADHILLLSLPGFPLVRPNDDLAAMVITAMEQSRMYPADGDVLVLAQKIVSKAEGRYLDLAEVEPSQRAQDVAAQVKRDARFVEAVLCESRRIVRQAPDVLIVEHRLGLVMANAGIDRSNIEPGMGTEPVLLLPVDPDASAARMLERLTDRFGLRMAVIVSDSFGRPWRRGTVGVALGSAGLPAVQDLRGRLDLYGRALRITEIGLADEIAAAASLLMSQADEGRPAVLMRGLRWSQPATTAADLIRPPGEDLFR